MTIDVLKVSSKSNPNSVAGALAGVVRTTGFVEVQVVGAGALNQAVKAIAIARGYMATSGQDLMCRPTFADIHIDGESRTAIRLHRARSAPLDRMRSRSVSSRASPALLAKPKESAFHRPAGRTPRCPRCVPAATRPADAGTTRRMGALPASISSAPSAAR